MKPKIATRKKDIKRHQDIQLIYVRIKTTFNNTLLAITTPSGDVLFHTSAGVYGFKGPKKSTPYATKVITEKACEWLVSHKIKAFAIKVKGPHSYQESVFKTIAQYSRDTKYEYAVTAVSDVTPIAHNGCRARKVKHN